VWLDAGLDMAWTCNQGSGTKSESLGGLGLRDEAPPQDLSLFFRSWQVASERSGPALRSSALCNFTGPRKALIELHRISLEKEADVGGSATSPAH